MSKLLDERINILNNIFKAQSALDDFIDMRTEGAIVRSRARWTDLGEKNTRGGLGGRGGRSGLKPGAPQHLGAPQIYIFLKFLFDKNVFDFKKGLHLQKLLNFLKFWR